MLLYEEASKTNKMEKILTPEEKRQIDELLKKHRPWPEEKKTESQKDTTVMSEKGTKIVVKSEIAGMSSKSFKDRPMEKIEEASKRVYKVIGTDIEPEYDELDTEEEKTQVEMLTKNE